MEHLEAIGKNLCNRRSDFARAAVGAETHRKGAEPDDPENQQDRQT